MNPNLIIFIFALLMSAVAGFSEVAFRAIVVYYVVLASYFLLKEKL